MLPINFLYDKPVSDKPGHQYHYNYYDKKYYPTNGNFNNCYYDYHAPLQTVVEQNGVSTCSIVLEDILNTATPCIYVLTYRFFADVIIFNKDKQLLTGVNQEIIDMVNGGQCILILNDAHECFYYTEEFYSNLIQKLKLEGINNFKNVIVLTGNAYNKLDCKVLTVLHWQYFETATRMSNSEELETHISNTSKKRFLCLNRVNREIRFYFMYQIYKRGLLTNFLASLNTINDINEISSFNGNVYLDKIKHEPEFKEMLTKLPWIIDTPDFVTNHWNTIDYTMPTKSNIFIITETLFLSGLNNMFLTEKIYKPILLKMPFILLGNSGTLKFLRTMGYKTFGDLWDESYDEIENHESRIETILQLVQTLCELSESEFQEKMATAELITKHNFDLLMERRSEQVVINFIKERYENSNDRMR